VIILNNQRRSHGGIGACPPRRRGKNFFLRPTDLDLLLYTGYDTLTKFWYHDYSLTTLGLLEFLLVYSKITFKSNFAIDQQKFSYCHTVICYC